MITRRRAVPAKTSGLSPTTPPEPDAIAAANRLVECLLAAIDLWEATQSKKELREHRGTLTDELGAFRGTLIELSDGIAQMGGSATEEIDRELSQAVADIDWNHDERALRLVLCHVRRQLVSSCGAVERCEPVPLETRVAVRRLGTSLRATIILNDDLPSF